MNDLDALLRSSLHDEAKEISMSVDMGEAEKTLQEHLRRAERRRRIVYAVGGVAAAVAVGALVVGGIRWGQSSGPVLPSTPADGYRYTSENIDPVVNATLPGWVGDSGVVTFREPTRQQFKQAQCDGLCADGQDRGLYVFEVRQAYPVAAGAALVRNPGYEQYVALWRDVAGQGRATVHDVATTTVGGRPATTMSVDFTADATGLAPCITPYQSAQECFSIAAGRTFRIAIVDQGAGQAPTLLAEAWNTRNPASAAFPEEFDGWLRSVAFSAAPSSSSTSASVHTTEGLTPRVSVALPTWAMDPLAMVGKADYQEVFECQAASCASRHLIALFTAAHAYLKEGAPITPLVGYAEYAAAWTSLDPALGVVSGVTRTTVGGRPATVLTVRYTSTHSTLVPCPSATSSTADCGDFPATATNRIAVVDQGASRPPTLLLEEWNTGDPHAADYQKEFDTWLKTVTFLQ